LIEFHINNVYTKVDKKKATYEELKRLHQFLSVKVPGHYFSPKFRHGMWDGYKRFFNLLTCTFYTGLLQYAISGIEGIEYKIIDERVHPEIQHNLLQLNGIEFRDYQIEMIERGIEATRGIIAAPTNGGKTEVAAGIIKRVGLPANFLTHRLTLLRQTKQRFEKRLGVEVGIIGGGEEEIRDINIMSVATVFKRLDDPKILDLLKRESVVFVDEAHHASAATIEKCLKACSNSVYRFGLSATALLRDDVSNMIVRGLLGDEIVTVTSADLIKAGVSAFPSVYLLKVTEPKIPQHYTFDLAYDHGIMDNKVRNELIVSSADRFLKLDKSVFIFVWRITHGDILLKMFQDKKIEVEFISGKEKPDYIKDVLDRFSAKKLKCVISSTISDEGLDVPAIDVAIMGVGFKAPLKTIQRMGRALREKVGTENVVTIVDFVDFHSKRYLLKHSIDRCREYLKMGVPIFEVVDNDWDNIKEA